MLSMLNLQAQINNVFMFKVFTQSILVLPVLAFFVSVSIVSADVSENLVTNPSFETATELGDKPASWTEAGWGTNIRFFEYLSTGAFDGTRSISVTLAQQLDVDNNPITLTGDAKWMPAETIVEPGANYVYTDHYRSSVPSRVVVRLNRGTCVTQDVGCTYTDLASLPSSTPWKKFQIQFAIPDDVVSISVFHLIEGVGTIELDAVSLEKVIDIVVEDMIPNQSVEQSYGEGIGAMPLAWYMGSWGTNSVDFEYVTNDAEDGSQSVKVTLSDYTSGDAKWFYEPQAVVAGEDYKFTGWYKSNIVPHVVVQFFKADNSVSYFGLQRPQPQGSGWQKYESEFSAPAGVVKATVFFFIDEVGYVQSDNYRILPFTYEGYDRALVSLTFDDGAEANIDTVLPLVDSLGLKTTHCYATEYVEGDAIQISRVQAFYNAGHEICSHTVSHPDLTKVTPQELQYQLVHSKEVLETVIGSSVPNFAAPFGAYNEAVNNTIKTIYASHRTVDEGYNAKNNFDKYRLKVQNMKPTTTLAEFKEWVNKAMADKTWLILVYHDVNTEQVGVTPYGTYTPDFTEQMNWLASTGVTVKTFQGALDEVTGVTPVCPTGTTLNIHSCEPIVCPTGTLLNGNTCEPIQCPTGSSLNGNTCEPIICGTGTILNGNTCEPIVCNTGFSLVGNTCEPIVCPTGTLLNGNTCEPIVCATGSLLVGNTCEPIICGTGTQLVGNTCEPIICATGTVLSGNTCVPIVCGTGFSLVGNTCVADPIICPTGTTLSGTACVPNPRRGGGSGSKPRVMSVVATTTATTSPVVGAVLGVSTSTASTSSQFERNLKLGMRGVDVAELQRHLATLGLYTGPITEYYGPLTEAAVKAYQTQSDLPVTGLVGALTREKLNGGVKPVASPQPALPTAPTAVTPPLQDLLARIKELQAILAGLTGGANPQ
jgi:peptidoglycan/xylan/chitin deacetylase (PgdA/CDA1 family)